MEIPRARPGLTAKAYDQSTGVASFTFYGPPQWHGSGQVTVNNPTCNRARCSKEFVGQVPIGTTMPDGTQTIRVRAFDAAGNASGQDAIVDLDFDLVPPPMPSAVTLDAYDAPSSLAVLGINPGEVDSDVLDDGEPLSPVDLLSYRWRRPGGTFTAWTPAYDVLGVQRAARRDH